MRSKLSKSIVVGLVLAVFSISAQAQGFWVHGKIVRTLSQADAYGGCMILMDTPIGHACPSNFNYVSLDCEGHYSRAGGDKAYTSALMAYALDKSVSVFIDDAKKLNTYCVAIRLDF